jgi:Domain of unknown function (DUF2017)
MEPFRSTRGGGVRAWLAASEASLLRSLVGQVMTLIAADDPDDPADPADPSSPVDPFSPVDPADLVSPEGPADPAGPAGHRDAPGAPDWADIAGLEALLDDPGAGEPGPAPKAPEDPVLARLLPDGYRDDPEAAGEFRKYTEPTLRNAKQRAAQEMLDTLPAAGGRIQLTPEQAQAWLKALNDVRLALGVRLEVTEDFEQQWARLDAADPRWTAYEVYAWLGAVQESLVQAVR